MSSLSLFPSKQRSFDLKTDAPQTMERLKSMTDFTTTFTKKPLRGTIEGQSFKLISSKVNLVVFVVMKGSVTESGGCVIATVHPVSRLLVGIIMLAPGALILVNVVLGYMPPELLVVGILQGLVIHFVFLGLLFRINSASSFRILANALDAVYTD